MTILGPPWGQYPYPRGHKIHSFGRDIYGLLKCAVSFYSVTAKVTKKTFYN